MPRIPYPETETLPESVRKFIADRPSNITRMLGVGSEGVFHSVLGLIMAFIEGSPISPKHREIAILRVGYLSNAAYEVYQHESLARFVGMTDEDIAAIKEGGAAGTVLGTDGMALLDFVDDVVANVRPGDDTLASLRRHFSDTEVVDLTLIVGAYMMMCRFMETTGIELDGETMDWDAFAVPSGG